MKEIIQTNLDSCVGCNRCVRECPMELANITYLDEIGAIKVKIDHTACINCGRCIFVCKHNSRVYTDDTERFFADLSAGVPISLIVAPAIRTNISNYKRLFTYFKNLGIKKIYDVSFGADICTWAYIRYMEQGGIKKIPLITQPCPVIVSYCEIRKPELLKYLSPIHSPMACISIYINKYESINHRIAALSPCIAKSDEFEDTKLAQYNITFIKLTEYLKANSIDLPEEETGFDCHDSGFGVIFPMPGGLKENIKLYFGENIHVLRAEGFEVFRKLDAYAVTEEEVLPEIFDVLNCVEGCNIGSGCSRDKNIFAIDHAMKKSRKEAADKCGKEYFEKLYKEYDNKFKLSDFMRTYYEIHIPHPQVTDSGIKKAFEALNKDGFEEQNFDCGACGSDTCYNMARKIALGVNIPINCIVKDMEDAKSALEQAAAASRAKGDFLSTMSHEMRTPMNAIIGMTAIGKKAGDVEGKDLALNKIGDASSHLLGVINDVLDMAKIEANKLELAPVEYDFEKMLQKVMTVVNFRADEKQQRLFINVDRKIPRFIIGDDQRLAQVITNLLSNAVKFTPEGGEIHFKAFFCLGKKLGAAEGEAFAAGKTAGTGETGGNFELCIEIADNGIGISPEQQVKLFQPFEQAESGTSREYGGTGLGLVISKNIVELMGGRIWVESELGRGAKFAFTVKAQHGENSSRSLLAPGVNWETVRILVVDDSLETRRQFQELFSQVNIKCDVASDGLEACRIIEKCGEYDIYFIDWRMPGMDGIALTRKIKSCKSGRPSVAIMITAMDWEQIKDTASDAGVDKHLLKPLFSSMIIDCVNECLGTSRNQGDDTQDMDGEFAGRRMLLAEDIEINREILTALLENTGIAIEYAENGKEALNMITAAPDRYDIVFMDVQMPKMDGYETTRRIRALPALRDAGLPIVAMTANVFKSDIEACLTAGMDDHLGKPLDIDRVLEVLRKFLSR